MLLLSFVKFTFMIVLNDVVCVCGIFFFDPFSTLEPAAGVEGKRATTGCGRRSYSKCT